MTSVSAGHIIQTPTQPVGSGRPQRESNPGPPHQESRALPQSYRAPHERERERKREKKRERERKSERERETERDREGARDRQRDRERERETAREMAGVRNPVTPLSLAPVLEDSILYARAQVITVSS